MSSPLLIAVFGARDAEPARLLGERGFQTTSLPLEALAAFAAGQRPMDVAVVDLRREPRLPDDIAGFKRRHPKVPVILIAATLEPTLILGAMRAGIAECLTEPLSADAFESAIARVRAPLSEVRGELFAFVGAKGGIGTTTAAVNVAAALARTRERTLFIDLHVAYGDAAVFLGAEPRFSVVDALEHIQRLDDSVFKTLVVTTASGLDLLGSSTQGVVRAVDGQRVKTLLEFVLQRYRYVVVDCPRSDATILDSLDLASKILLVANQDLAALRSGSRISTTLRQRYPGDRVMVVVSRFDPKADIGRDDVARVIGSSVHHVMPSDYRVSLEALNRGVPLVTKNHTKLASALDHLARELGGVAAAPAPTSESTSGFLGRLTGRR